MRRTGSQMQAFLGKPLGGLPEPGEFSPGTMVIRFKVRTRGWWVSPTTGTASEGVSFGHGWLDIDAKAVRPVSETSSVSVIQVHGWKGENAETADTTFFFDRDTGHGYLRLR